MTFVDFVIYYTSCRLLLIRYCSEECGRRLARNRLMAIMPQRIQEWHSTPTVANDMGREELERIRCRGEQARKELQALGMVCIKFIKKMLSFVYFISTNDARDPLKLFIKVLMHWLTTYRPKF